MKLDKLIRHPFFIVLCMGAISFGVGVYSIDYAKKNNASHLIREELDKKVDKRTCDIFINDIDDKVKALDKRVDKLEDRMIKIQTGVAFLVGKYDDGDPGSMGLLD